MRTAAAPAAMAPAQSWNRGGTVLTAAKYPPAPTAKARPYTIMSVTNATSVCVLVGGFTTQSFPPRRSRQSRAKRLASLGSRSTGDPEPPGDFVMIRTRPAIGLRLSTSSEYWALSR